LIDIQTGYKAIVQKQQELTTLTRELSAESDAKKKEEAQQKVDAGTKDLKQLHDRTKLVIDSLNSPKPFDTLAQLYRGLIAARFGDYPTTQSVLASTAWETIGSADSAERMAAEFAVLGLSRALVDAPDSAALVKNILSNLAAKGNYASVQAALTLATVASTPEEKASALNLLNDVSKRFPTQEKFLAPARERVGV
jgi:hypothetical protein